MNNIEEARQIVGYDIRKGESVGQLFLTSHNESVRFEHLYEQVYANFLSGMNLFGVDPSTIPNLPLPLGARVIAFDLPTPCVAKLLAGNVSVPAVSSLSSLGNEWSFMGFDVVDPYTQLSGLHEKYIDCSPASVEFSEGLSLNERGLIADFNSSLRIAKVFDIEVPQHSPFHPCGVWLKS